MGNKRVLIIVHQTNHTYKVIITHDINLCLSHSDKLNGPQTELRKWCAEHGAQYSLLSTELITTDKIHILAETAKRYMCLLHTTA